MKSSVSTTLSRQTPIVLCFSSDVIMIGLQSMRLIPSPCSIWPFKSLDVNEIRKIYDALESIATSRAARPYPEEIGSDINGRTSKNE
ncbi:hypothetical protein TNCT_59951 [Trichonephila clavata]|uniref:Uncharacterized protein n=1 Tax=Trichonephila clavata TaxID=2740835 RepID=A0A8X6JPR3_TRICU|nr:hypothetical protein TNCT_59951 [Trichonephila clavata]